ncbi:MAG: hypothetical protein Q7U83_13805 [Daejeonella sp.]|nr:hypothetical protein [Daejeonella sp.]
MKKYKFIYAIALSLFLVQGCKKDLLQVENENQPDFDKVFSNGEALQNLASGLYVTIYNGEHGASSIQPMLATASDNISCSWGNFGMRDMSWEPRNFAWNNAPSYAYNASTLNLWNRMYSSINTASDVLKAMGTGVNVGVAGANNARTKAFCRFAQGVGYGNLALIFDKAFIVDEKTTVAGATLESASAYTAVAAAALVYLDEAAALATANTFTIPKDWLGADKDYSAAEFKKLVNTYAARFMAYTPRNKAQLAAVNWAKVKTYADGGLTSDFVVMQDGYAKWYDEAGDYLVYQGWGVTDNYVVNMMDPSKPKHWTDVSTFPYPTRSTDPADKRIFSDFEYVASQWFQAARGYYHYSPYRNKRYDDMYVAAVGPKPQIMKAENDMLKAEARAYTADLSGAATIINASTRKTRGQMADVAAVSADVIQAIHHERHVEMYTTGFGLQFFEMRKLDLLQKGTPLHFPIPAKTQETMGLALPFYTFGTEAKGDGTNTSNKGWR